MRLRLLVPALLVFLVVGFLYYQKHAGFTPWMSDMEVYFFPLGEKDENGKNHWDRRHWLTDIEGRWHNGRMEWRVRAGDAPAKGPYWWYWYYNQDEASFNRHILRLTDEQFTLVSWTSFELPDGSKRYAGIWHRTHKPKVWKRD